MPKYKKGTEEHDALIEKIQTLADSTLNGSVSDNYSGRGMFGRVCYGVDGDNDIEMIMLCGELGLPRPMVDNMGRGYIVYWPQIEGNS